jgi:hypothetical protein
VKVFISWSGSKSRALAVALSEWLPGVINSVEPFASSRDIHAGTRWQLELAEQLESTNFGIVCVTQENQRAPWLNFEAGALAKAVNTSRVVPLALDLKPSDLELPLGQFQAQAATEPGVTEVLKAMNAASDAPLSEALLERAVKKWWPDLKAELDRIEREAVPSPPVQTQERSERELLEETLDTVRSLARTQSLVPSGAAVHRIPPQPFIDELVAMLHNYESELTLVTYGAQRRLQVQTRHPVPPAVQEAAREGALRYGFELDFTPRFRPPRPDLDRGQEAAGTQSPEEESDQ